MQEIEKVILFVRFVLGCFDLTFFAFILKPLKSANMSEVVPEWDANFVDIEQELLFELILVSFCFVGLEKLFLI